MAPTGLWLSTRKAAVLQILCAPVHSRIPSVLALEDWYCLVVRAVGRRQPALLNLVLTECTRLLVPSISAVQKTRPTPTGHSLEYMRPSVLSAPFVTATSAQPASLIPTIASVSLEFQFLWNLMVTVIPESLLFDTDPYLLPSTSWSPDMCPVPTESLSVWMLHPYQVARRGRWRGLLKVSRISVLGFSFHYHGTFFPKTSKESEYPHERHSPYCWYGHPWVPLPDLCFNSLS